jgi:hypothetical protein
MALNKWRVLTTVLLIIAAVNSRERVRKSPCGMREIAASCHANKIALPPKLKKLSRNSGAPSRRNMKPNLAAGRPLAAFARAISCRGRNFQRNRTGVPARNAKRNHSRSADTDEDVRSFCVQRLLATLPKRKRTVRPSRIAKRDSGLSIALWHHVSGIHALNTYFRTLLFVAVATSSGVLLLHPPDNVLTAIRRPHFTDISSRSNISYITNNDFHGRKYFQQPMCGGIAILDYDQDGLMDIFFTNGAKLPELKKTNSSFYNCLLRNKGDGTFEDVTKKAGLATH